jgi:hypothetical protein
MLTQKSFRPDSIVAHFCSQAAPRRLLQQNLPEADLARWLLAKPIFSIDQLRLVPDKLLALADEVIE